MHCRQLCLLAILCCTFSCDSGPKTLEDILYGDLQTVVNPSGRVPLGALLTFNTKEACRVSISVAGENPIERGFTATSRLHEIPVLGLYPDQDNVVDILLTTEDGVEYEGSTTIKTAPLPATFPEIKINTLNRPKMEAGWHLFDLQVANNGKFLTYTVLFDDAGKVRWFMDMSENGQITYTPYRLRNGNWLYLNWQNLLSVDDLGRTVSEEVMPGTAGNHEIMEMADGKLLMGGSMGNSFVIRDEQQIGTRFDHLILYDPAAKTTANHWDMRKVMDVDRSFFPADYSIDAASDWFHVNAFALDPVDNGIIVSGRSQGVVKISPDNQPQWILAPHLGWGNAGFDGNGPATTDYLLTAVDGQGQPYPPEIQRGEVSAPDFDWPQGQHALTLLPNGNLLLFDNGLYRNMDPSPRYSRAVEYAIDPEAMTVTQVWQYGKERGREMASPITSDVDVLPQTGNRLITAGNIRGGEKRPHASIVEITYPEKEVVFEADLFFRDANGNGEKSWGQFDLVFRGERYALVPGE